MGDSKYPYINISMNVIITAFIITFTIPYINVFMNVF